jgi:hypothetical protein
MSKYIGTKAVNLSTTSADVTGNADIDGNLTVGGNLTVSGTTITVDHATAQTVDLGDNDKIRLGDGNDLEIYHDGQNSYIDDTATGFLHLRGDSRVKIGSVISGDTMASFIAEGEVQLFHNNVQKFATKSTGVDITGTLTADDHVYIEGNAARLSFGENDTTDLNTRFSLQTGSFRLETVNDSFASAVNRITLDNTTGDISFYEDTGTTAKFFWDASAASLGLGVTSISTQGDLYIGGTGNSDDVLIGLSPTNSSGGQNPLSQIGASADGTYGSTLYFNTRSTGGTVAERMRVTSNGDVSIGSDHSGFSGWRTLNIRGQSTGGILNFENNDGTRAFAFASQGAMMRYQAQLTGGSHKFETNAKSSGAFIITDSGDVGIGAMSPTANLSIDAGSATGTHLDITTTGSGHNFDMVDGTSTARIRNVSGVLRLGADHNNEAADSYVRIDVDNTERLRITPDGIKFNGDTAAANALDDYEEGTWTPTLTGATSNPTVSYGNRKGYYTKIGNQVTAHCFVSGSFSGGSGGVRVYGLPYTSSSSTNFTSAVWWEPLNVGDTGRQIMLYLQSSATNVILYKLESNGTAQDAQVQWSEVNGIEIRFSFTYIV